MKRKVGTTLDAKLYQEIKEIARRQGRSTNAVIEDALSRFLSSGISTASAVAETKGSFSVPTKAVRAVLREDLYGTE